MKKKLIIPAFLAIMLAACAYNQSLVNTAYKSLSVSQTSYDTAMKIIADLDREGHLSTSARDDMLKAANIYHDAHNTAVDTLVTYQETKSDSDEEKLEKQLIAASEALSQLLKTIEPYLGVSR